MTCPPYASFFRPQLIDRSLLLSCMLALSVVTTIATVSGLAGASRVLAVRALTRKAALLPAPGATATFNINANGAKEVTSTGTPNQGDVDGTAIGTITFDNGTGSGNTGSAIINLTLTNLDTGTIDLTGHHIHQAPSTTTGPIVIDFGDPDTIRSGNTLSGTITGLPAATITSLMANSSGFYYNLHNAQFTGGAVRDQLGDASQTGPTLTVNSTADPGDGVCTTNNCTLREAITAANNIAGANTITFDPIVFAAPGPYTINLGSRLPDLITDMTITGPGANILTVNRNAAAAFRIFTIHGNATVQIHGLTMTNGNDGVGGAILVGFNSSDKGTLTLTNVAVTNNTATSTISGGGGINLLHGALTVINSTISGNHAPNASSSGGGGGLFIQGTLTVVNSTISGNDSNSYGGGILNFNGTVSLSNSTIANNTATRGGGLLRLNGTTTLKSTIVADNTASTNPDVDANGGAILSDGFNLIENTGSTTITQNGGAGPNITGLDPQLNPLADNGGQTDTHSLKTNSPAIDKGRNFAVDASNNPINADQRGQTRPFNTAVANATGGDGSDIGAFEAQAAEVDADNDGTPDDVDTDDDNDGVSDANDLCPETPASATVNSSGCTVFTVNSVDDDAASGSTTNGICTTGQTVTVNSVSVPECTLRAAIQEAQGSAGADFISFDPVVFATAGGPYTINLASALPDLTTDMTITGSGANVLTVRRNAAASFRIFTVRGNSTVRISGLTMTNGNQGSGGAILVGFGSASTGTVTLANVAVTNNTAPNTLGGGIAVGFGSLTLIDSTVSGNHSNGVGGGGGGGIGVINSATVSVVNSTISGNDSTTFGGGLYSTGMALVTITNSTVSNNTAPQGGGLYTSGTINVGSTIVANNSATGGTGPDLSGAFNSLDYNLFENTSGATFTGTTTHDITGQDPQLLPLSPNGGPTETHALSSTSPAIDQGKSFGSTTDQRGQPRPFDIASIAPATGGDNSDIGAFELQNSTPLAVAPSPSPSTNEDTAVVITLTGTDSEDNNLTFTITDAPDNGSLVPLAAPDCSATNSCTATYTYTPNPDYFGGDSFKFKVNDGKVDSTEETVTITINAVNDVPSFTKGADQTVFNSAPQTITNWATNLSAGPANESAQALDFIVTNDNNALFAAQPTIDPSGTLTFTPAPGMSGTATISVKIHDNGGTALGGQDTSAVQTFVITVNLTGWSISGANGATEDESNPQRPTYTNFTAAANAGSPAGTYVLRYNITAMGNLTSVGAVSTRLRVRFRDDGTGSQVTIAIIRSSILGGSETLGTIFDSDAYTPGSGFQTQEILMPAITFDFTQNTYWLEVRMSKTNELNQPGIGSVQFNQQ